MPQQDLSLLTLHELVTAQTEIIATLIDIRKRRMDWAESDLNAWYRTELPKLEAINNELHVQTNPEYPDAQAAWNDANQQVIEFDRELEVAS